MFLEFPWFLITLFAAMFSLINQTKTVTGNPQSKKAFDYWREGNQLFKLGDYRDAISALDKAIARDKSNGSYYKLRGKCHLNVENYFSALDDFKEAVRKLDKERGAVLQLDEDDLITLGKKFDEYDKECEKSVWCYSEAIKLNQSKAEYYILRGDCYLVLGDVNEAISDFKTATKIDKKMPLTREERLLHMAMSLKSKQIDEFIEGDRFRFTNYSPQQPRLSIMDYFRLFPRGSDCFVHGPNSFLSYISYLGILHYSEHKQISSTKIAVVINLKTIFDYICLGKLADYMMTFNTERAIYLYSEVIKLSPADPDYFHNRALCFRKIKEPKKALSDFKEEFRLNSDRRDALVNIVRVLHSMKNFHQAIKATHDMTEDELTAEVKHFTDNLDDLEFADLLLTEAIRRDSNEPSFYVMRGKILARKEDWDNAIDDLQEALKINLNDIENNKTLIEIFIKAGKLKDAAKQMRLPCLSDEDLFQWGFEVSKCNTTKLKEAVLYYTEALNKNSRKLKYYENRGICYKAMKKYTDAISDFKEALRYSPTPRKYTEINLNLAESLLAEEMFDEAKVVLKDLQLNGKDVTLSDRPRIDAIYKTIYGMMNVNS